MDQDKEEHIHIFGPYGCWCGEKSVVQSYRFRLTIGIIATVVVLMICFYALYRFSR